MVVKLDSPCIEYQASSGSAALELELVEHSNVASALLSPRVAVQSRGSPTAAARTTYTLCAV